MYLTPHRNNLGIINNCSCYSLLCIPNVSIYSYMGSTGFTKTSCVTVLLFPLCVVLFYKAVFLRKMMKNEKKVRIPKCHFNEKTHVISRSTSDVMVNLLDTFLDIYYQCIIKVKFNLGKKKDFHEKIACRGILYSKNDFKYVY